jgi:peptide/nickel transport system substrate-binding protein
MKKLRWPFLIVLLALAVIGALLYTQRAPELPAIIPVEEVEPVTGGSYSEALVGEFNRLNPLFDLYNQPDHDINRLLFSGLLKFDDRGSPLGDLAESWGISLDGMVYNFSIRENAVWHDGSPVTSEDVLFTIEMMRAEEAPVPADIRDLWSKVEVIALDEKIVQFRLPEAYAPFLDYLAFGVLPAHLLEGLSPEELVDSEFNLTPVGSGPYRLSSLIVEAGAIRGVELAAFQDYFGQKAFIEQLIFRYYPDSASAYQAYQSGQVMGIGSISTDVLQEVLKDPGLNFYTGRLPRMTIVFLNLDNPESPFFQDKEVRLAMMQAANRQWMVDNLLGGQAILARGPIFPGTWAYFEAPDWPEFDPEGALELLKAAGYTYLADGEPARAKEGQPPLRFDLLHPDTPQHQAIAEALRRDWLRLGIEANPVAIPYDQLVSDYLEPRLYQAALVDLNLTRSPDPDPYPFWHEAQAAGGQNYSRWADRQASEYLEQARIATDPGERARYYKNFQVRFNKELPALPLFYPVYTYAVDDEVQGIRMGPLFDPSDRLASAASWYLEARRAPVQEVNLANPTPEGEGE